MNKLDIIGSLMPSTTLSNVPGYNAGDQYLTQIGTFTIWVTTDAECIIILPAVSAFRLGTANFKIFDISGTASTHAVTVQFQDGALVNGSSSIVLNTNYGNLQIQLQDGEWFANLNGSGGGGGTLTGASNGLSLNGSIVQMGGPLIQNTLVNGLETNYLRFANSDASFILEFGNLTPLGGIFNDKSFTVGASTSNQLIFEFLVKDLGWAARNTDNVSNISRSISLITTSAGESALPTGGIQITEEYRAVGFGYLMGISSRSIGLSISNGNLIAPNQSPASLTMNDTQIYCYKYINNSDQTGVQNGWEINTSPDQLILYWHGTIANVNAGSVLQIDANGYSCVVGGVLKFRIDSGGEITTVLQSFANDAAAGAGGLTTGMLYRCSSSTPANAILAKV